MSMSKKNFPRVYKISVLSRSPAIQKELRIGNSSSVLERAFADAVRSIANRRVQLRNDINLIFRPQGNRDRFKNLKSIGQIIRSKKIPIHFKFLNLS